MANPIGHFELIGQRKKSGAVTNEYAGKFWRRPGEGAHKRDDYAVACVVDKVNRFIFSGLQHSVELCFRQRLYIIDRNVCSLAPLDNPMTNVNKFRRNAANATRNDAMHYSSR